MGFSCTKCGHQIGGGMTHCAFCGSRQDISAIEVGILWPLKLIVKTLFEMFFSVVWLVRFLKERQERKQAELRDAQSKRNSIKDGE